MPKIHPFLWFDDQAEAAMDFYLSVFDDSKVLSLSRYGDAGPGEAGKVMTVSLEIAGQRFTLLNGGPYFKFTEAVSFVVDCKDQAEVDRYWAALLEGGQASQCGWLKDRFGLSWQIVPADLMQVLNGPDPEGAKRATQAMLKMIKLDIGELRKAYAGP